MTNTEEVVSGIEKMIKAEGGIEEEIYNLLSTAYNDPDARVKTLVYLASLEFVKLKARFDDTGQFMHIHGPLASSIHTLLDIIYRNDTGKILFTLDRVREGVLEEVQQPKPDSRRSKMDDYLRRWK